MWDHDVEKPIVYGIHKDKCSKKPRHFLDAFLKSKAHVPPPNASHNKQNSFILKTNMLN